MITASLDQRTRLAHGKKMEKRIAQSLKQQGLAIKESSDCQDRLQKVDRWLVEYSARIPLQIKFRESGDDLLFEVFDTFHAWDDPHNKIGRDVEGIAKLYAVLMRDGKTIIMVPAKSAKDVIDEMLREAKRGGWTYKTANKATLRYYASGCNLELKVQFDPFDGRSKMVAYIPQEFFCKESSIKSYKLL